MALAASLVPAIPQYERGEDCLVERSTSNTGENCQQGGQECTNQCSSVPVQDCSAPAQPVCVTVTEQKCEIQYETVYEEVCEPGPPGGEQCQTVEEEVCTTVEEEQCQTVREQVCETEYNTVTREQCGTEMETKCETEVRQGGGGSGVQCLMFVSVHGQVRGTVQDSHGGPVHHCGRTTGMFSFIFQLWLHEATKLIACSSISIYQAVYNI